MLSCYYHMSECWKHVDRRSGLEVFYWKLHLLLGIFIFSPNYALPRSFGRQHPLASLYHLSRAHILDYCIANYLLLFSSILALHVMWGHNAHKTVTWGPTANNQAKSTSSKNSLRNCVLKGSGSGEASWQAPLQMSSIADSVLIAPGLTGSSFRM